MRIGACVVRVAVFSEMVYIAVQKNVACNANRDSTTKPQYMTLFEIICPGPFFYLLGVYVSITV